MNCMVFFKAILGIKLLSAVRDGKVKNAIDLIKRDADTTKADGVSLRWRNQKSGVHIGVVRSNHSQFLPNKNIILKS